MRYRLKCIPLLRVLSLLGLWTFLGAGSCPPSGVPPLISTSTLKNRFAQETCEAIVPGANCVQYAHCITSFGNEATCHSRLVAGAYGGSVPVYDEPILENRVQAGTGMKYQIDIGTRRARIPATTVARVFACRSDGNTAASCYARQYAILYQRPSCYGPDCGPRPPIPDLIPCNDEV